MIMNRIVQRKLGILLLLTLSLMACSDWFVDEQRLMEKAKDYIDSRSINAAAIELRNVLQVNPDNAEARYLLAGINLTFGDFSTAEKEFGRAELAGWDPGQARAGIARCHIGMGRFQLLLDTLAPEETWGVAARADMMALRAVAEAGIGNLAQAEQTLEQARLLAPESLQVMKTRVQLAIVAGRQDDARQLLDVAMKTHSDNQELLLLDAGQRVTDDQSDAVRSAYQKVIALDPPDYVSAFGRNARLRLAQIQIMSRDLEAASQLIQPLFHRDPNDPFTNYLGGLIAFEQAQYQLAEEMLLKVLKLVPDHNPTRLLFGVVNFAEKNFEQAAYFLGKYIDAVPGNLIARKMLARSYILLGRAEEASTVLRDVVSDDTNDAELLTLVGRSDLERGERVAGIAGLEKALKASPGDLAIRSELARAYIESGDTGLAIHELQSMLTDGGERQQTETLLVLAHLRADEFAEAISLVLDMLGKDPDNAVIQTLAGSVFASSGDRSEARKHLNRALEIKPGLPPAILSLAQIEEMEGNLDQATILYEQLVEMKLNSALPMLALSRVAEQKNDREKMLSWLERALEYAPSDPKPRLFLAEYHLRNGTPGLAEPLIAVALETAPREPELLLMMGRILLARQQYQQALKTLDDLLAIEPDSVRGHTLRGEAYLQLNRTDDARSELQIALDNEPANVGALALLARLEISAQDYDKSVQYSKDIQQAYPELYLGYELNGDALAGNAKLADAARLYTLAWDRLPSEELAIKRADIASRGSNFTAAVGYLQEWIDGHPDAIRAREFLGSNLQKMGERALAITQYEQILQVEQKNLVALNNLAVLYQSADRVKALQLAERAWRLDSSNPGVQDTYGWLLVEEGQLERGRQLLEKALKVLGDVPEVRYHHAVAVYRSGDEARGKELLQALLEQHGNFDGSDDAAQLLKVQ